MKTKNGKAKAKGKGAFSKAAAKIAANFKALEKAFEAELASDAVAWADLEDDDFELE